MSDWTQENSNSISLDKEFLSEYDQILDEYEDHKVVKSLRYNSNTTSFMIPAIGGFVKRVVTLDKTNCEYKKLIFSAIYTAFYHYYFTDDYSLATKKEFRSYSVFIVDYLNNYTFIEGKEVRFLKSYEAFRINKYNILPQSTGLAPLLKWITLVSTINAYSEKLAHWQTQFFVSVSKIKALGNANYESRQATMTDWFGFSTWLRRDDVGVGHDLYSKLASPKALVNSFVATITAELNEIQLAKDALINFFKVHKIEPSEFPRMEKEEFFKSYTDYRTHLSQHRLVQLNKLREIYHGTKTKDGYVKLAMILVVKEFTSGHSTEFMLKRFFNNQPLFRRKKTGGKTISLLSQDSTETLFSSRLLTELVEYANLPNIHNFDKPKSVGEQVIFSWIMAYQTVQPSDVLKLKLSDFKLVKRVNRRVTHIDLEYFKGRSNTLHQVRTLETKSLLGLVVLKYIQDFSNGRLEDFNKKIIANCNTFRSTESKLFELAGCEIADRVNDHLVKEKASPVFIKSMLAILRSGKRYDNKTNTSYEKYLVSGDLICRKKLFSLTAIKNSSIHSRSDTFTPTQLINHHSHSDDVEKIKYLTSSNEEWLNNAGLITRAVMQDLARNLYRASLTERAEFNSEFTHAVQIIANKKNDTLSQMKVVTGKDQGDVNNLGLVKRTVGSKVDFADTIYILDTPETVFKLLHYRSQVKQNHHLLVAASPEFLLFTVLPTVEWIEELFDKKSFSKESVCGGHEFFKQYKNDLPKLFQNQIS